MIAARLYRALRRLLPSLVDDRRGSSDLNTYLLLTAAGCTMVGLTAPHLFKSSKTASNTFEKQVQILERGAGGGTGSSSSSSSGGEWNMPSNPGSGLGNVGSSNLVSSSSSGGATVTGTGALNNGGSSTTTTPAAAPAATTPVANPLVSLSPPK